MTAAAAPSPDVRASGETYGKVVLLRPLRRGGAKLPWVSYAAHGQQEQGAELLVADRFPRSMPASAAIEEDARVLLDWPHPNLAMVRDVIVDEDAIVVLSDFIEAERLDELRRPTGKEQMPLEIGLRIVVDVLAALSALHGVRKGLIHGQVFASNIIVGHDGIARLVRGYLGRGGLDFADPSCIGYAAPEILRGDEGIDARADVYSAGVLLWETLSQRRYNAAGTKATILANLSKPRPKAMVPTSAAWANALIEVADKALSGDPTGRYATAAEMAAAVRLIVRARLAMPPKVASWVDKVAGARIIQRRAELGVPAENSVRHSRPSVPGDALRALDLMRPPSRPPEKTPGAPKAIIPMAPPEPRISSIDELESDMLEDAPDSKPQQQVAPAAVAKTPIAAPVAKPAASAELIAPPDFLPSPDEVVAAPAPKKAADKPAERIATPPMPARVVVSAPVERVVTPAPEPVITPAPIPAPAIDATAEDRGVETHRRPRAPTQKIVAAVLGFAVLLLVVAGIKIAVNAFSASSTPSASVATSRPPTIAATPTPTPTPSPTPNPTPIATTTESAPVPVETATTAQPTSTSRPRPRPKSTYDPQGI